MMRWPYTWKEHLAIIIVIAFFLLMLVLAIT